MLNKTNKIFFVLSKKRHGEFFFANIQVHVSQKMKINALQSTSFKLFDNTDIIQKKKKPTIEIHKGNKLEIQGKK